MATTSHLKILRS